jgi:hypothetical protein
MIEEPLGGQKGGGLLSPTPRSAARLADLCRSPSALASPARLQRKYSESQVEPA